MDERFKERLEISELVEQYQNEIDQLIMTSPELAEFQRSVENHLDQAGDLRTPEGRHLRSAAAFHLLKESFVRLSESLDEYQSLLKIKIGLHKEGIQD